MQGRARLPAARVHHRLLVQGGGDAERVPGAVGEVRSPPYFHCVRRRHPRKGWGHAYGLAVRLQQQDAIRPQAGIAGSDVVLNTREFGGNLGQRGCLTCQKLNLEPTTKASGGVV